MVRDSGGRQSADKRQQQPCKSEQRNEKRSREGQQSKEEEMRATTFHDPTIHCPIAAPRGRCLIFAKRRKDLLLSDAKEASHSPNITNKSLQKQSGERFRP